jgi:DnaK suppressor protein
MGEGVGSEKIGATPRTIAMAEGNVIMRTNPSMRKDRYEELKRILEGRRLEILGEVQHKMRDVRAEGAAVSGQGVRDEAESSEAEIQDDIEFALLQMKAETLSKIGEALSRLEGGSYGYCYECGDEIAEQRLRALPFAVRCKSGRRGATSLFADLTG